ncbi:MAG: LysM domain-containing protein, partial [Xanthomonadales bacterium PRO6]|nr:LysM domain-containing protein [Xanthomonadales bacterium PRO6]
MVERVDDTPPPRPRVTPATPADGGATYTVQPGDTLYKISVQYGIDYRDLAAWNGIAAPYTIYPRQRLRVQSGSALVASPPPPAAAPAAGAGRADVAA